MLPLKSLCGLKGLQYIIHFCASRSTTLKVLDKIFLLYNTTSSLTQVRREPRLESPRSPELNRDFEQFSYWQRRGPKAPFPGPSAISLCFRKAARGLKHRYARGATPRWAVSAHARGRSRRGKASPKLARETKKQQGARTRLPSPPAGCGPAAAYLLILSPGVLQPSSP